MKSDLRPVTSRKVILVPSAESECVAVAFESGSPSSSLWSAAAAAVSCICFVHCVECGRFLSTCWSKQCGTGSVPEGGFLLR